MSSENLPWKSALSTYLPADMFRFQGAKELIEHRDVYIQMKAIDELDPTVAFIFSYLTFWEFNVIPRMA